MEGDFQDVAVVAEGQTQNLTLLPDPTSWPCPPPQMGEGEREPVRGARLSSAASTQVFNMGKF